MLAAAVLIGCGGNTTSQAPAVTGVVRTTISDPPACAAAFDHVYVTVTEVTAHISSTAEESESGWVTLADLTSAPKQVDLLHLPGAGTCILSQSLGLTNGLPVGKYQQIRLYLLANDASSGPANNQCGASAFKADSHSWPGASNRKLAETHSMQMQNTSRVLELDIGLKQDQGYNSISRRDSLLRKSAVTCNVRGRIADTRGKHNELSGISFLASRRLRGYTCLPPVWPSAHNIFPQMVPLAPFRPSGVLKTNALPASGSVFFRHRCVPGLAEDQFLCC